VQRSHAHHATSISCEFIDARKWLANGLYFYVAFIGLRSPYYTDRFFRPPAYQPATTTRGWVMKHLSVRKALSYPGFNVAATATSKSYIFTFFIFCGVVAYLDSPPLGLWLIAILVAGMFATSVLIACPVTWIKLSLVTNAGIAPVNFGGKVLHRVIDLAGYVALWFASRYALNL